MSLTRQLAQFIAGLGYDDLPKEAIVQAKRAIMDTVGVALAGCREEGPSILVALARERGAEGPAPLWGWPLALPAPQAALINGASAHAIDYDDVNVNMRGHPSAPVLPTAFALCHELGLDGRHLILAFVLGIEVEAKLGAIMGGRHYALGWHPTSTLGTLGAAAASAKLLGLDVAKVEMALGIAASMASGVRANFGTMTKPLHVGLAARNGVEAALMASRGFTASANALEAEDGFLATFLGGRYEGSPLPPLGQPFDIVHPGLGQKRYPCCYATHRALDAALELAPKVKASEIAKVIVRVSRGTLMPLQRERPRTGLEGKFSMEYCVATALLDGRVAMSSFTDEAVSRPEVDRLMDLVHVEEGPEDGDPSQMWAEVAVQLKSGQSKSLRVDVAKGDPRRPLTWEELAEKFRDCAYTCLPPDQVEEALDLFSHLEDVESLDRLAKILQGKGGDI